MFPHASKKHKTMTNETYDIETAHRLELLADDLRTNADFMSQIENAKPFTYELRTTANVATDWASALRRKHRRAD